MLVTRKADETNALDEVTAAKIAKARREIGAHRKRGGFEGEDGQESTIAGRGDKLRLGGGEVRVPL